jgi:hypothetical protein
MRKSFRKTLPAVSGFTVRMRTVFVPYVLFPSSDHLDELEAGNEEHTVVLCVEIDNAGDSGVGFAVESVDVNIGGEGASASLIGWGEAGFRDPGKVFPLRIGPMEQYNLLYAVTFLRPPDADEMRLGDSRPDFQKIAMKTGDLQRAVSIIINGRPFEKREDRASAAGDYGYPTRPFSSRWNCVLDLSPRRNRMSVRDSRDLDSLGLASARDALPEPASPFPEIMNPHTAKASSFAQAQAQTPTSAVAGIKRHTLATTTAAGLESATRKTAPVNYRSSTSMLNPAFQRDPPGSAASTSKVPGSASVLPPSINVQTANRRPPTTYDGPSPAPGPRSPPLPALPPGATRPSLDSEFGAAQDVYAAIPPTPAYPAYDPHSPLPPPAHSQGPVQGQHAGAVGIGPSVEARRQRGVAMKDGMGTVTPGTPGPTAGMGMPAAMRTGLFGHGHGGEEDADEGEPIVVSVGLLPRERCHGADSKSGSEDEDDDEGEVDQKIYPLDKFTLDVFVFNQSSWTRRFELSIPDKRRRRQERMEATYFADVPGATGGMVDRISKDMYCQGIVPLENRIRIG